jgi:hypothetical protein
MWPTPKQGSAWPKRSRQRRWWLGRLWLAAMRAGGGRRVRAPLWHGGGSGLPMTVWPSRRSTEGGSERRCGVHGGGSRCRQAYSGGVESVVLAGGDLEFWDKSEIARKASYYL